MATRKKVVEDYSRAAGVLPSILASLGLVKKPNFDDWEDEDKHRIHWAIHILRYGWPSPIIDIDFHHYICGPYSIPLEEVLEAMDWSEVASAVLIDNEEINTVRDAIRKGDDFLEALSIAVGVADHNSGISKQEVSEMVSYIRPWYSDIADDVCDFAEARIWSK